MPLQIRRGIEADRTSITPDAGEPIYTTDEKKVYIGDGTTAGGVLVGGSGAWQPLDADLTAIAALSYADNNFIVGNGATWVVESGATARTSLGLGTMATETAANYLTTAAAAAAYQPLDADLTTIAGLSSADSNFIVGSATGWVVESGATARTSLGLGTMATETAADYLTTAAAAAAYQPLDSDLTTIGGLAKTDGNFIVADGAAWTVESGATARTSLGLGTMATETAANYLTTAAAAAAYQPLDTDLTALAGLTSAADKVPYFTGAGTAGTADFTAYGRSVVAVADEAAFKALTNLEIGTDVQAYDADLTTIGGLAKTDGNFIVADGAAWTVESGATARTSLGLGTMATETAANYLTTAAAASTYQPLDAGLTDIAALAVTDGNIIVGDGANWVVESGATARTSLGAAASAITLTAGVGLAGGGDLSANRTFDIDITELTAEATVDGAADYVIMYDASASAHRKVLVSNISSGSGVSSFNSRTGAVVPASGDYAVADITGLSADLANKQPLDAGLTDIAALAVTDGNIIVGDGANWVAESGATARTSLGLGTGDSPSFAGATLTSTDAGAAAAPLLDLYRNSASPAVNDVLGEVQFNGMSSTGVKRKYTWNTGYILDHTNASEDGQWRIGGMKAGADATFGWWQAGSLAVYTADDSATRGPQLNLYRYSASPAASDYIGHVSYIGYSSTAVEREYAYHTVKVNSPTNAAENAEHQFFGLRNGTNRFIFSAGFNANTPSITVYDDDAGATVGPYLYIYRDSASPAANDVMGQIQWAGKDSAANFQSYATATAQILDHTSASEDSRLYFETQLAGAAVETLSLAGKVATVTSMKEGTFTITDGVAFEIDPANGGIQKVTLGASRTPAATNFAAGQSVLLGIADGTAYTITWTTVNPTWVGGSAPTLATTGWTWIELWKEGTTIYGALVGDTA